MNTLKSLAVKIDFGPEGDKKWSFAINGVYIALGSVIASIASLIPWG